MKPETLSILRTPGGKEKVQTLCQYEAGKEKKEALYHADSKTIFPIQLGIPIFYGQDRHQDGRKDHFYEMVAPMYDFLHHIQSARKGGERKMREEFLQELNIASGDKVLEVSVGTGANLRYLPSDAQYYGLDISWEMLKRCASNLRKLDIDAELVMGNAEALPFADDAFDVVFNALGFRQIHDKAGALAEMIRVAKPGGKIVVADQLKTGAPIDLLPSSGIYKVDTKEVEGWKMYCLSFYKNI